MTRTAPILLLLLVAALCAQTAKEPQTITGKVTAITDGDTLKVLADKTETTIRLVAIDAPESKQPFGTKSKEHLASLCFGKTVSVTVAGKDTYGRTLGTVHTTENVNAAMIRDGFAWHFVRYSKDKTLAKLEADARASKRGLWAAEAVAPWEWRAAEQAKRKEPQSPKGQPAQPANQGR